MNTQICTKCNLEKPLIEFYKHKTNKSGFDHRCKDCIKNNLKKKYNSEDKKERNNKRRDYQRKYQKQYRSKNRQKHLNYQKKYREENLDKIKNYQKQYQEERRQQDPFYRLKCSLRSRIWAALKSEKSRTTKELLGASFEIVKEHLENTFTEGMSWDNYGEWHVDHKVPLASAETEKQLYSLCHYKNLQALWAEDNWSKSAKYVKN